MDENFYLHRNFEEFEEFAENLRLWNIQIKKLQGGKSTNILKQLKLGDIQLAYGYFRDKTHQVGDTPSGKTIAFHGGNNSQLVWRKKKVPHNGLMIFPNNSELDAVTKGIHNNIYTITIPKEILNSRVNAEAQNVHYNLVSTQDLICIPTDCLIRLKNLFQICFQALENSPELITSQAFETNIQEELLDTLSPVLMPIKSELQQSRRTSSYQLWSRIEEVIKASLNSPIKVNELSRATGTTDRTLQRLFRERFGLSPKKYLTRVRLNGVRHNLKKSSLGEVKIVDIANDWGFWHMGQFAADYMQLFGELPSATLSST